MQGGNFPDVAFEAGNSEAISFKSGLHWAKRALAQSRQAVSRFSRIRLDFEKLISLAQRVEKDCLIS